MKSILFAIPCYGGMLSDGTGTGLYQSAKAFDRAGIRNEMLMVSNESLISTGRSNIASFFLNETAHDYIMCIDADIGFMPDDVFKLLELDVPFSAGAYSMKTLPPKVNFGLQGNVLEWNDAKTAFKVSHIGTGFQLVHRVVFEDIIKSGFVTRYMPTSTSRIPSEKEINNSFHYYESYIHPTTGHIVPEDIAFCNRYTKAGGTIWLRPDLKLKHVGSHEFTIDTLYDDLKDL